MKKLAFLFAAAAFVGITQAQPYAAWTRNATVTINTATVGAPLTNYPVLVRFSSASLAAGSNILSDAKANGADLRFTDSTGNTALAYEIDTWSATNGAAWVRLPSVPAAGSLKIRVYWGNSAATTASSASGVFDSAANFVGVWHLGNATGVAVRPNAITGAPGATPANDGGSFGGGAGAYVAPTGQIGNADDLRGTGSRSGPDAGSDYLNIGNPAGFVTGTYVGTNTYAGYNDFSTGLTYSFWVNARTVNVAYTYVLELGNTSACSDNIQVFRPASDNRFRWENCNGTTSGGTTSQSTNGTLTNGSWEFYTVTAGTGATPAVTFYRNGVRVNGPTNRTQPISNTLRTNTWIGKSNYDVDGYFNGSIDEARLSRVARDSNWVKLDYATQRSDSSAVSLGATAAAKALFYPTKNGVYVINDSVSNTPVLSGALTGSFSINPVASNLPTGLSFSTTTGALTGKVTAVKASTQFIVTATVGGVASADTITVTVTAGTPPGKPTALAGARSSKTVTLTWVAPTSTGSSAITGYKAMAVPDTTKTCSTTAAVTCAITGLTNGTAYRFVVKASNSAGAGAASDTTAAITPAGIPGAPTAVSATAVGGNVTVTWTAPSDSGSAILEYYCVTAPVGGSCYLAAPAPLSTTVSGLTAGTSYTVAVYAVNGIGTGPNSVPSAPVTPVGINPGSFVIRVSGSAKPFTFVLPEEALTASEKVTMSISDIYGRTVWSKSVDTKVEKVKELTWNGKSSNGHSVSAGMYVVKISTVAGGKTSEFTQKAISVKPL